MPKMYLTTFGGRAPPGPGGEAYAPPDPIATMGLTSNDRREGGEGLLVKGGREGERAYF